jgi:hypothetical protein
VLGLYPLLVYVGLSTGTGSAGERGVGGGAELVLLLPRPDGLDEEEKERCWKEWVVEELLGKYGSAHGAS